MTNTKEGYLELAILKKWFSTRSHVPFFSSYNEYYLKRDMMKYGKYHILSIYAKGTLVIYSFLKS